MLTKTPTATFIRHYVEMVVVMFAGMLVLGLPGEAALQAIGSGTSVLRHEAPSLVFLGMAATMTIPMVAWMLLGMLVAMLLRLDEYTSHADHAHHAVAA